MAKYRKKPVEIEAFRFTSSELSGLPQWFTQAVSASKVMLHDANRTLTIETLEGMMTALPGDWIIRGVKNEIYPCKPDIFELTYMDADEPTFTLRAQDMLSVATVEEWITRAVDNPCVSRDKIASAKRVRDAMVRWPVKKVPD